jgi:23S rRNA (adenine-N6)-dimethyltransferase
VFANLPFDATAAMVERLVRAPIPPHDAYLVMQPEAAQRFAGQPRETLVAVLLKAWFEPTIVHRFRRTDFTPAPRVDVVMLRLRKRGPPLVQHSDRGFYRDLVVALFTSTRRTLLDSLRALLGSRRARRIAAHVGLTAATTPAGLPFERWLELFGEVQAADLHPRIAGAERRLIGQQRRLHKVHRTVTPRTRHRSHARASGPHGPPLAGRPNGLLPGRGPGRAIHLRPLLH